ncbi:related to protein conferring sensitivity to killer toxin [Phialocephala subalpina]|uniref:Elongator complex protein 5 n=1 Tax=Phialocephala subalpina TaxID=576137 RepID=A0A1L7X543_9HELO|nr:related to protein conferring sensitivity to killer toxin [Phialocephala subalpina]
MAPSPLQQRRTHNTLLFQKLLNLREGASPFTLVLDTLEQSGGPLVREFARRAKISKSKIVFISFSTLKKKVPFDVDSFISTRGKSLATLRTEILSHLPPPPTTAPASTSNVAKHLLIIDDLRPLASNHAHHISPFLSSLLIAPQISLLATYHTDITLPTATAISSYQPPPLTTLTYLATAILAVSSLPQVLARKRARDKSLQEPVFGLDEHREGIIVGFNGEDNAGMPGVVVNMELRRRSGRGVVENFVLMPASAPTSASKLSGISVFVLLEEHPLYATVPIVAAPDGNRGEEGVETTFNLNLTEKQKRDREGVVLPYFDAQKDGGAAGPGEGGRILYEMGAEDREDFDDEEDEI